MSTPLSALKSAEEQPSLHHDEIAQLIREIHEERQAIKDRERAERWTIWVSLCIVVFAVFAAIGGQQDSSVSTSLVLLQSQASDTWAYYQAKAIKQRVALAELNGAGTPEQARAA